MIRRIGRAAPLAAVAWLALAVPGRGEKLRNHFDSDAPMRIPGYFDFAILGQPGRAEWIVIADFNPPSAPNQVTQTVTALPADSFAVALRRNALFRDGAVSVAIKAPSRAGLVLRHSGGKDFLLLLVDGATGEGRLTSYRDGKPSDLARATAAGGPEWGMLSVELAGSSVIARWNGKELLRGTDPAPAAGRAGMAASGRASFDELVLEPAGETPRAPS